MTKRAEVIGAGIVGLGIAALLAQRGWSVRVHEQHSEIREVGAAIGIKPGAAAVLDHLGILDRLTSTNVLTTEERRDGNGRVLQSRVLKGGGRFYNPLRQDLVDNLGETAMAYGAEIKTASRVLGCAADGTLEIQDEGIQQADLVIAADGFHSRSRSQLGLEKKAKLLSAGTTRVLIPREDEEAMRLEYWSGSLRIGVAPANDTLTYVYLSAPESDPDAIRVPIDADYWASRFPGLPRRFFDRIQKAGGVRHRYPLVYCHSYSRGRVALLGDSAHALPATLGIGASMGLVNAYRLVEALGEDVEQSLTRWSAARRPPSVWVQKCAVAYSVMTVYCPTRLQPARNSFLSLLNRPAINYRLLGLRALEV